MSRCMLLRESCVHGREAMDEALTAARLGRVSSTENLDVRSAESFHWDEGNTGRLAMARGEWAPRCRRPQGTQVRPTPGPGRSSGCPGPSRPGPPREGR